MAEWCPTQLNAKPTSLRGKVKRFGLGKRRNKEKLAEMDNLEPWALDFYGMMWKNRLASQWVTFPASLPDQVDMLALVAS